MSNTINLPTVSAKIVGDASGLVSELKTAQNATNLTTAKMSSELEHFSKTISRKFSLAHVGTDIMRGLGIGTGFHLAEKAAEKIAEHWKAAADAAAEVERSSAKQLDLLERQLREGRDDKEQEAWLKKQISRLEKDRVQLSAPRYAEYVTPGQMGMPSLKTRTLLEPTDEIKVALQKNAEDLQDFGGQLTAVQKKIAEANRQMRIEVDRANDAQAALARQLTESVETPMERYQRKIIEIADEMNGFVSDETFNRLMARAKQEYEDAVAPAELATAPRRERPHDDWTRFGLLGGISGIGSSVMDKQIQLLTQIRDAIKGDGMRRMATWNSQLYFI